MRSEWIVSAESLAIALLSAYWARMTDSHSINANNKGCNESQFCGPS